MLTETGRVVAIETDGLWVETIRRSTCGACAAQQGCGHGLVSRVSRGKRGYIRILPADGSVDHYSVGDQVLFSIPEEVILRGSFIAYVLPLLTMLVGAAAAARYLAGNDDVLAMLGAAAGLVLGYALLYWHSLRHRGDPAIQPVLQTNVSPPLKTVTVD